MPVLRRISIGLCLLVSLSACQHAAVIKPTDGETDWREDDIVFAQRDTDFSKLPEWRYSARVGVVTQDIREQANLIWRFRDQANSVRLFGPLGAGQLKIEFDQFGVQLSDKRGVLGDSAEQLLTQIAGWPIPIDALAHWLFVLPAPDHEYQYRLDDSGNVASLRQLGWRIDFDNYRDYAGVQMPRKLTAIRRLRESNNESVTVKLVTKGWQWE